jgi:hypothetical protein
MIDQQQQRTEPRVLQAILQGTEIKVITLEQLLRFEQVRHDHYIEWALVSR